MLHQRQMSSCLVQFHFSLIQVIPDTECHFWLTKWRMTIRSCMNGMGCKKRKLEGFTWSWCFLFCFRRFNTCSNQIYDLLNLFKKNRQFYNLFYNHSVHKKQDTLATAVALDPDCCFFFFFFQGFDCARRPLLFRDHRIRRQFHCRAKWAQCSISGLENKSTKSCLGLWMKEHLFK